MTNTNIKHINNFLHHTDHFFGMTYHQDCCICSESIGIIKTFSSKEAKEQGSDEMFVSIDRSIPIDSFNLANAYKYAMYIYEKPETCSDWDNRISATALLSNDITAFLHCAKIIVDHHIMSNNIDYLHPDTTLPEDMQFEITAITENGIDILQNHNCSTKQELQNVEKILREKLDEHIM